MGNKRWTKEETDFLKNNSEMNILDIQKTIKRTKRSIEHKFYNLKIKRPKLKFNRDYFKIWSYNMAYILGFTMADGCISNEGRLRYGVKNTDIDILKFICKEIGLSQKYIKTYQHFDKRTNKIYTSANLRFTISDNKHINNLGIIPRKTGKELIPIDIPKKYIGSFILGFFDGDGSVFDIGNKRIGINITSASKMILLQIKKFFGFGNIYTKNNIYEWCCAKQEDVFQFYTNIYKLEDFSLDRKKNKFKGCFDE